MNRQHPSSSSYAVPLYDTTALISSLANPYPQHCASHYYQAYVRAYTSGLHRTTSDGYSLSSTYVPGAGSQTSGGTLSIPTPSLPYRPSVQTPTQTTVKPIINHLTYGSWYQPGNCRCTRQGCPFTGSRKSVEIHMMDRHFIFPPGWVKKDEWDADPSLRGKPIAIQGTSLILDTPETIDAWIAERKRRFPTDAKIQDKKRRLEEAAARGQLVPENIGASARKRRKQNAAHAEGSSKSLRGQGYSRGRGPRYQGLVRCEQHRAEDANVSTNQPASVETKCTQEACPISELTTDDEPPEVLSSKVPVSLELDVQRNSVGQMAHARLQERFRRISQPTKAPKNPFASRPTLLRNLLIPEIRITVSNLSQAIHFLVENDFLRDVELRPGEACERMIEVLGSSNVPVTNQVPTK